MKPEKKRDDFIKDAGRARRRDAEMKSQACHGQPNDASQRIKLFCEGSESNGSGYANAAPLRSVGRRLFHLNGKE